MISAGLGDCPGVLLFGAGGSSLRAMRVEEKLRVEMKVHLFNDLDSTCEGLCNGDCR